MKRFLVTNDDGIKAAGIVRLVSELSAYGEVYVAAPATQQSAKSQSITFMREVSITETAMLGAAAAYEVGGTPADCINWGVGWFGEKGISFDQVFSGINLGANVGLAAYYSGTIGAAREGALQGVRSIALSVGTHLATEFDYTCSLIPKLIEMSDSLSPSTILSFNAPDLPMWAVKGVRIAEAAPWGYGENYVFSEVGEGRFQMAQQLHDWAAKKFSKEHEGAYGKLSAGGKDFMSDLPLGAEELKYDFDCFYSGYASVSPLISHVSDRTALSRLNGLFPQEKTLVVITDVQDKLVSGVTDKERFEENIIKLAKCVGRLDLPSVITELYGSGQTVSAVAEGANRGGRSETVLRREYSAWGSVEFARLMNTSSVERIIIAGLETHSGVLQTALGSVERGYDVTVIEDCCASGSDHDHKMAIERLRDAGCTVMTLKAAVTQMLYMVSHPAAGSVMKIIGE